MKLLIADNYTALSQQAAADLIKLAGNEKAPLVCPATGDTPAGLYKVLVDKVNNKEVDISCWHFLGLDEWVGMNGEDEGSCRFHLNNQLLFPLQVASDNIIFFDGRANNLQEECSKTEAFIRQQGTIDISVLGLGMNGHIGMNEPGTAIDTRSHVGELDAETQKVGQKYFNTAQRLTAGITLGLGTLMESKHILLLISGAHKAAIVKKALEGAISEKVPGSLLRNHPSLRIYLDKEAAQLLAF